MKRSEQNLQQDKRPLAKKLYAIMWLAITLFVIIALSFGGGTFYPNNFTVQKLKDQIHTQEVEKVKFLGLQEPEFEFNDSLSFIDTTKKCIEYINFTNDRRQRIPTSMIIAMAGVESAWGTSRFAVEGNNLFGIRTWDLKNVAHMKAKGNPDANWGVKKYKTKCQSVKDMIRILNNHPAYAEFRAERDLQVEEGKWNYPSLLALINAWSTTPDYGNIIHKTILDRKLP